MQLAEWTTRLANEHDFAQVGDLLEQVYILEGFVPESARPMLRNVEAIARSGSLLIATDQEHVVQGSVLLVRHGSTLAQMAREREGECRLLAVAPSMRRRGVGALLMTECVARGQQARFNQIVLSTQPSMDSAQRLYERLGFAREPGRDWTHKNGTSRLAFALAIPGGAPETNLNARSTFCRVNVR
jgi:ribosomal protein S18 acetylase RimI-like enzyme